MNIIYIILPISVLLGAAFVAAFVFAARKGQFDDLKTPTVRMLFHDDD